MQNVCIVMIGAEWHQGNSIYLQSCGTLKQVLQKSQMWDKNLAMDSEAKRRQISSLFYSFTCWDIGVVKQDIYSFPTAQITIRCICMSDKMFFLNSIK